MSNPHANHQGEPGDTGTGGSGRVTLLPSALWQALDAEAEIWARETDLASWLAQLSSDPRSREKLGAVTRLCFEEGFYRGAMAAIEKRSLADSINEAASVPTSPDRVGEEVGRALAAFVAAEAERVRTIEAYNAELTHQRERGIFPPKVQAEYEAMEHARRAFWTSQHDLLSVASAPSPDPAGAGGDLNTEDDAEIDRIMSLSSDELRAELAAEGHDPDRVLENAQRGLDGILRLAADRKRWRDEAASWRRVAERLEEEKQALRQSREAL